MARARHDRKLRGPYALFFLGHVHRPDEPYFVGYQPSDLLHAAAGLWGPGWAYAGLWATAADREYTLREVHRLRPERTAAALGDLLTIAALARATPEVPDGR